MSAELPTDAERVESFGLALFGSEWGSPMGRLCGVNQRTMSRIKAAAQMGKDYAAAPGVLAAFAEAIEGFHVQTAKWRDAPAAYRLQPVEQAALYRATRTPEKTAAQPPKPAPAPTPAPKAVEPGPGAAGGVGGGKLQPMSTDGKPLPPRGAKQKAGKPAKR